MCARDKFEKHVFEDVYFGAAHIPSASASCTFELFSVDLTMAMDICSPAGPSKFLDQLENPWCLSRFFYVWQKCTLTFFAVAKSSRGTHKKNEVWRRDAHSHLGLSFYQGPKPTNEVPGSFEQHPAWLQ
jgi:hypothetical protein